MPELTKFAALTKVDARLRQVWGVMAAEEPDHSREVLDYTSSKPLFEKWSQGISAATNGASKGNVRAMHQPIAAGKVIDIEYDDLNKRFLIGVEVVDEAEWRKCEAAVYTGFSIGGAYASRWPDGATGLTRYTAQPIEVSLVDNPCIPGAVFTAVKMDGSTELRKFATPGDLDKAAPPTDAEPPAAPPQAEAVAEATVSMIENMLDMEAAEETVEDATEDDGDDPTVEVSLAIIATLHAQVVALGARCLGTTPWSAQEAEIAAALGRPQPPEPVPSNPLDYVLAQLHDTLVALGAECTGAAKYALPADLAKVGAAISAVNMARMREIHDHTAAMGACPATQAEAAPAAEAPVDEEPVAKAVPLNLADGLADGVKTMQAQIATLSAELVKAAEAVTAHETQRAALEARITALEATPAAVGPALTAEALAARPAEKRLPGALDLAGTVNAEIAALEAVVYDPARPELERQAAGRQLAEVRKRFPY